MTMVSHDLGTQIILVLKFGLNLFFMSDIYDTSITLLAFYLV